MSEIKEYSNADITIVWDQTKCIHAAQCVKNARRVFRPKERPWVQMEKGSTEEIVSAVRKCPSGALTVQED